MTKKKKNLGEDNFDSFMMFSRKKYLEIVEILNYARKQLWAFEN